MICLIAMIVFAVLGIFSARYRKLAKESFICVFRRLVFKPCETHLDQRIKMKMTSSLLKISPALSRFAYKRFEILSWIFVIAFFASMAYTGYSIYNLVVFHTCDPSNPSSCILGVEKGCGCDGCVCSQETCGSPEYKACSGNCSCIKELCNK